MKWIASQERRCDILATYLANSRLLSALWRMTANGRGRVETPLELHSTSL